MVVAIDGPAGAGKSTVARHLARRIGGAYLNTGAMYRAVALIAAREGIDAHDGSGLAAAAAGHDVRLEPGIEGERVLIDGEDVTDAIRSPDVASAVSAVAANAALRRVVVAQQQRILAEGVWVADGRDIGTVVAPDAEVKIFLTADPEVRARRRHDELRLAGHDVAYADVLRDLAARDVADAEREASPLTVAADAHVVDTTGMDIDQVTAALAAIVARHRGGGA